LNIFIQLIKLIYAPIIIKSLMYALINSVRKKLSFAHHKNANAENYINYA